MAISPTEIVDWRIYRITSPSNRVYIGVTSKFKNRMECYRNFKRKSAGTQPLIYKSLCKYGYSSHKIDIVESFSSTKDYAFGKEIFWIRSFMANANKWGAALGGLNLTDGGEGTLGQKHTDSQKEAYKRRAKFTHTEATKRRMSEAKTGVSNYKLIGRKMNLSDEERKRRSLQGKVNSQKLIGRKHTEESKKKMSISQSIRDFSYLIGRKMPPSHSLRLIEQNKGNKYSLGKHHSDESKKKMAESSFKVILLYDKNGVFLKEYPSVRVTAIDLKKHETAISMYLTGVRKHKDLIFKYK